MAAAIHRPATDNKTRILLVDDHAVVRFGIGQLLAREPDLVVCGEEEDAAHGMLAIEKLRPDLVVADISLKESSGLELMRNIKARFPRLPILVISAHDESMYAEVAFRAGALGYLMKGEALEQVVKAVRRVLSGNVYVSDALARKMLTRQVTGKREAEGDPVTRLSDRELEVFQMIGRWKKTTAIASELHLSVKTIEYYREQIKHKMGLRDGAELVQHATSWVRQQNIL